MQVPLLHIVGDLKHSSLSMHELRSAVRTYPGLHMHWNEPLKLLQWPFWHTSCNSHSSTSINVKKHFRGKKAKSLIQLLLHYINSIFYHSIHSESDWVCTLMDRNIYSYQLYFHKVQFQDKDYQWCIHQYLKPVIKNMTKIKK